jgi:hypothetical protein
MTDEFLEHFLGEENVKDLRNDIWPCHLHVAEPDIELARSLSRKLGRNPLLSVLSRPGSGPKPSIRAFRDTPGKSVHQRSGRSLLKYIRCRLNYSFLFDRGGDHFPVLRELEESWAAHFRILPSMVTAKLSLSRRSVPFPLHFDACATAQIQIRGTKEWYVAENSSLTTPLTGFMRGEKVLSGTSDPCKESIPDEPTQFSRYVLNPGDVLFVPWGYWHKTLARTRSLSLAIVLKPPSWIAFLPKEFHAKVRLSDAWRSPAMNVWADAKGREAGIERLSALIDSTTTGSGDSSRDLLGQQSPAELFDSLYRGYATGELRP